MSKREYLILEIHFNGTFTIPDDLYLLGTPITPDFEQMIARRLDEKFKPKKKKK